MSEEEVNELTAKLDCYETCIEQLQREIPRYLSRINEGEKQAIGFIKAIRKVASLEGESNMQSVLFLCASKYEVLQLESKMYDNLQDYTSVTLADAKDKIIFPLKEVIQDMKTTSKKQSQKALQAQQGNDKKMATISHENNTAYTRYSAQSFPIHAKLFEKHRITSIKRIMISLLQTELRYHCRAVEELTTAINALSEI